MCGFRMLEGVHFAAVTSTTFSRCEHAVMIIYTLFAVKYMRVFLSLVKIMSFVVFNLIA